MADYYDNLFENSFKLQSDITNKLPNRKNTTTNSLIKI